MSIIDDVIKKLKDTPWEEQSRAAVEAERITIKGVKIAVPFSVPIMKKFLRDQLAGHAKDDIAKRMFAHYLDGSGQDFFLTLDDMKSMNNGIDLRAKGLNDRAAKPEWTAACTAARAGTPADYSGRLHWGWDNGAIANYSVLYKGTVTATGGVCVWAGQVEFFDRFDLDPRWGWSPSNQQGRSKGGERRTRIGYILDLGTDYDMKSPKADATQGENDSALTFTGTATSTAPAAGDL
ncbi:MAG: hypothetical protein ACRC33_05355 [Gemmataceae bacterium]